MNHDHQLCNGSISVPPAWLEMQHNVRTRVGLKVAQILAGHCQTNADLERVPPK